MVVGPVFPLRGAEGVEVEERCEGPFPRGEGGSIEEAPAPPGMGLAFLKGGHAPLGEAELRKGVGVALEGLQRFPVALSQGLRGAGLALCPGPLSAYPGLGGGAADLGELSFRGGRHGISARGGGRRIGAAGEDEEEGKGQGASCQRVCHGHDLREGQGPEG